MKRRKISQLAARTALKRVAELERVDRERRNRFSQDYPGGAHIATVAMDVHMTGRCEGAQMVGCALVARCDGPSLRIYALSEGLP